MKLNCFALVCKLFYRISKKVFKKSSNTCKLSSVCNFMKVQWSREKLTILYMALRDPSQNKKAFQTLGMQIINLRWKRHNYYDTASINLIIYNALIGNKSLVLHYFSTYIPNIKKVVVALAIT